MGRPKLTSTERRCKACQETKPNSEFYQVTRRDIHGAAYPAQRTTCIACERTINLARYHAAPQDRKGRDLRQRLAKYNLTPERFHERLKAQSNKCPICLQPDPKYVDHAHKCCDGQHSCGNCVRGILCRNCNTALGLFNDSPEALVRASQYLKDAR